MAVARQFGRTGGATGMKVGSNVGGRNAAATEQPVAALFPARSIKIEHAGRQWMGGWFIQWRNTQHVRQSRHLRAYAQGLGPDARIVVGTPGKQHFGFTGVEQRHQLFFAEKRVKRLHNAGSLATPERQMVFHATGQHHAYGISHLHAKTV